jgi:hypothetical protein
VAKSHWHLDDTWVKEKAKQEEGHEISAGNPFPRKHLPKCCKSYKKYQGIMPPKCAGGEGCQVCWLIYEVKNDIN